MRALLSILMLMAAIAPTRVSAQSPAPRTEDRWFLSVGISPLSYRHASLEENEVPAGSSSRLDLALGGPATLAIGYGILEVFVVELQASVQRTQNGGDNEDDLRADDPARVFYDHVRSTTAVSVGPIARLLLSRSDFQPFVEAGFGFGWTHSEVSNTSFSLKALSARAGLGGQWRFADAASVATALTIGFESTSGSTSADDSTVVMVRGDPNRSAQPREVELGGDTVVLELDLRFSVWL